LSAHVNLLTK